MYKDIVRTKNTNDIIFVFLLWIHKQIFETLKKKNQLGIILGYEKYIVLFK